MNTDLNQPEHVHPKRTVIYKRGAPDAVYGVGMVGAWIYFISTAPTFWLGVLGFLKGLVWPAFVVFELMKFLNM